MSGVKEFGGCLWNLFQLGVVILILVLGFLFIANPQNGVSGDEQSGDGAGGPKPRGTGLVARLKGVFGGGGSERTAGDGRPGFGDDLWWSQREAGTGQADLETLLGRLEGNKTVRVQVEFLAEGTTRIRQTLYWQIHDGNIHYRILLRPYDRKAHAMMMRPGEALFMSFVSEDGERLVPKSTDHRIEMQFLRVATREGHAAGWFYDGHLPLAEVSPEAVHGGQVGWVFSNGLHARLRQLQAPEPAAGENGTKPFAIDIPVDGNRRPSGR